MSTFLELLSNSYARAASIIVSTCSRRCRACLSSTCSWSTWCPSSCPVVVEPHRLSLPTRRKSGRTTSTFSQSCQPPPSRRLASHLPQHQPARSSDHSQQYLRFNNKKSHVVNKPRDFCVLYEKTFYYCVIKITRNVNGHSGYIWYHRLTRSQAVARIADSRPTASQQTMYSRPNYPLICC